MAKKKKKSVLDYDPLAWLKETGDESAEQASSEDKKAIKKAVTKKTSQKKPAKKKTVKKQTTKKSVKKKTVRKKEAQKKKDTKKVSENTPVQTIEKTLQEEDESFGFFVDENTLTADSADNKDAENDDGFGFFVDVNTMTEANKAEQEKDDGFGFFNNATTEHNENTVTEEIKDEGFGFFSNDEELTAVNTETLNISKEEAINLGSELTIKTVTIVKEQIEERLSSDEDIVINADEMIKIDTAGLQLLYSLKESLSKTGHHIKWIGTSTVINDSAEIIGMPVLAPKSKEACFGFFEENIVAKDAEDGSSGFF